MGKMEIDAEKKKIFGGIKSFFDLKEDDHFVPGKSRVQYAGPVFGGEEVAAVVETMLGGWLGLSKRGSEFEAALSRYLGGGPSVLANSGSSANLLAMAALKAEDAPFRLREGDEVIVPACSFPTTVNPIIQNGFVPVLVDVQLGTYNIDPETLSKAAGERTKAIVVSHMFGNPNQMDAIMEFAEKRGIAVIEDNCDALGSSFKGKKTGSFGAMATHSFYPAHHITMGEGGAVVVNEKGFEPVVRSLRDWGRACVCPVCLVSVDPDFFCPMRFEQRVEGLPDGYDKKYIYTHIGYNLKPTEMQAAMGLEQLKRIGGFKKERQRNFNSLYGLFSEFQRFFVLPEALPESDVSWFCFPLTIKGNAKFGRAEMISFLEKRNNIETRLFFGSNIMRHPAYRGVKFRVAGGLENSDKILRDSLFIGVYPGITREKMAFVEEKIREFMKKHA